MGDKKVEMEPGRVGYICRERQREDRLKRERREKKGERAQGQGDGREGVIWVEKQTSLSKGTETEKWRIRAKSDEKKLRISSLRSAMSLNWAGRSGRKIWLKPEHCYYKYINEICYTGSTYCMFLKYLVGLYILHCKGYTGAGTTC